MTESNDASSQMPTKLIQVLTNEVKDTKGIIVKSYESMLQRRSEAKEYYEPAENLHKSIRNTRKQFQKKAEASLKLISNETEQLRQILLLNQTSIEELRKSAEYLQNIPTENNDYPMNLAIRSLSLLFPFMTFGIVSLCSQ